MSHTACMMSGGSEIDSCKTFVSVSQAIASQCFISYGTYDVWW